MFTVHVPNPRAADGSGIYKYDVDADSFHQDEALVIFEKTTTQDNAPESEDTAPSSGPFETRRVVAGFPIHSVAGIVETKED